MFVLRLYEMVVFKSVSLGTAGHPSRAVPEREMMEMRLRSVHDQREGSTSVHDAHLSLSLSLSLRVTLFFSLSYKDARRKVIGTTSWAAIGGGNLKRRLKTTNNKNHK